MAQQIRFGTDGWRAVIAREFTFANLAAVAQGIADTVKERGTAERGVIVGYDPRFLSEEFAEEVAAVMAGNGIRCLVGERDTPTPVLAHAVLEHQAAGAVILTASHNPPVYHGIKFVPEYASPAFPDITDRIEAHTAEALSDPAKIERDDSGRLVERFDPRPAYLDRLAEEIDFEAIRGAGLKVKVDCLHGAARGYLDTALERAGCEVEVFGANRDPLFGGDMPDPSEKRLAALAERVAADGAHLGLAADGDGDRFGVVDGSGKFLTPNQVIPPHGGHHPHGGRAGGATGIEGAGDARRLQVPGPGVAGDRRHPRRRGERRPRPARACAGEGRHPRRPAGGGDGGEDGAVAAGVSKRLDLHVADTAALMDRVTAAPPDRLAGSPVTKTVKVDGIKLIAEDGRWMLFRPSGTEPLVRVYLEAHNAADLTAMEEEARQLVGAGL